LHLFFENLTQRMTVLRNSRGWLVLELADKLLGGSMRVALYCRVSTFDQNSDIQVRELREYCQRRGWDISTEYVDVGISGSKDNRPELNKLMLDAHKRRFDAVVVWRFDRFARSVSHLLKALETFQSLGIEFVSYSEAIDTSTPVGKMTFTVLGGVAELERNLIRERTKAGVAYARSKGKQIGRPKVTVDPAQIASLRDSGLSNRAIAKMLDVSEGTIRKLAAKAA
jgi:DNA invertase Pin-like site-specific DNA recombinase